MNRLFREIDRVFPQDKRNRIF